MIEMTAEEAASNGVPLKRKGPRSERTRKAHKIVTDFAESGADVAEIDWQSVDEDYKRAKSAICSRIPRLRDERDDADDISLRSNRATMSVYLVHTDRVE